jgi:hypothetical protein
MGVMGDFGSKEIGRLGIRIVPITEDFKRQVREQLAELKNEDGTVPVDVNIDIDDAKLEEIRAKVQHKLEDMQVTLNVDADTGKADRDLRHLSNSKTVTFNADADTGKARLKFALLGRTRFVSFVPTINQPALASASRALAALSGGRILSDTGAQIRDLAANIDRAVPKIARLATGVAAASTGIGSLVSGLGSVFMGASRVLPLLFEFPGAIAAMGTGVGVLVTAWKNAGDATKQAKTEFTALAKQIGGSFWAEAETKLNSFSGEISTMFGPGLTSVSSQLGGMVASMFGQLERSAPQLRGIFTNISKAIDLSTPGINRLLSGFLQLSKTGTDLLPTFAGWVDKIGNKFTAWAKAEEETGALEARISQATEQAHYLLDAAKQLISVFHGIMSVTGSTGAGLATMDAELKGVAQTVNGSAFQKGAAPFFKQMRAGASELTAALPQIGTNLSLISKTGGYAIQSLMGDFTKLTLAATASATNPQFQKGMTNAVDGVDNLIDALDNLLPEVAPLLGSVGTLLAAISNNVADAGPGLDGFLQRLNQLISGPVTQLAVSLGPALALTLQDLSVAAQPVMSLIGTFATVLSKIPAPITAVVASTLLLGKAFKTVTSAVGGGGVFTAFSDSIKSAKSALQGLSGASADTGWLESWKRATQGTSQFTGLYTSNISKMKAVTSTAGAAIKSLGSSLLSAFGGPVGLLITGVSAAIMAVASNAAATKQAVASMSAAIQDASTDMTRQTAEYQQAVKDITSGDNLNWGIFQKVAVGHAPYGDAGSFLNTLNELGLSVQTVAQKMTSGESQADQYADALEAAGKKAKTLNPADQAKWDQVATFVRKYAAQVSDAEQETDALNDSLAKGASAQEREKTATQNAVTALTAQIQAEQGLIQAEQARANANYQAYYQEYQQKDALKQTKSAVADYVTALKKANDASKEHGAASTAAAQATKSANAAYDQAYQQLLQLSQGDLSYVNALTQTQEGQSRAVSTMTTLRNQFIHQAEAMGLSRQAAADLARQLGLIPSTVQSQVQVNTEQAKTQAADLGTWLGANLPNYTFQINGDGTSAVEAALGVKAKIDSQKSTLTITGDTSQATEALNGLNVKIGDKTYKVKVEADTSKVTKGLTVQDLQKMWTPMSSSASETVKKTNTELKSGLKSGAAAAKKAMSPYFSTMFDGINTAATKVAAQVPNWARPIGADLGQGFIDGVNSMRPKSTAAVRSLGTDAITTIRKALDSHSPSRVFRQIGKDLVAGFAQGVAGSSDDAADAFSTLLSKISDFQNSLISEIHTATKARNDELEKLYKNKKISRAVEQSLIGDSEQLKKAAKSELKARVKLVKQFINQQSSLTAPLWAQGDIAATNNFLAAYTGDANKLAAAARKGQISLADLARMKDTLGDELDDANQKLQDVESNYQSLVTSISSDVTQLASLTNLYGKAAEKAPVSTAGLLGSYADQVTQLAALANEVDRLRAEGLNGQTLQEAITDALQSGDTSKIDLLGQMTGNQIAQLNAYEQQIQGWGVTLGNQAALTMYGQAQNAAQQLVAGLQSQQNELAAATTQLTTIVNSMIQNGLVGNGKKLGKNFSNALAKGIKEGASAIKKAAIQAAKGAMQAAKQTLGINSPSKVGRQIGQFFSQGMALGIQDLSQAVSVSSRNVAQQAADAATRSVNTAYGAGAGLASQIVSNTAQPVVTVPDTIELGAASIQRMAAAGAQAANVVAVGAINSQARSQQTLRTTRGRTF